MIQDEDQYKRSVRFLSQLAEKIKDGSATPQERERYRNGCEAVVCWELEQLNHR